MGSSVNPHYTINYSQPDAKREWIWQIITRANTLRAVTELEAHIEQIPKEIEWLESLRAKVDESSDAQKAYRLAFTEIKKRRQELAALLFDDQRLKLYAQGTVEFVDIQPSSQTLNATKFPELLPPFTPDRPYLLVRVKTGKALELCRVYNGKSGVGGAFFFPCRNYYFKSSLEARDTGALPDANTTEFWRKVSFAGAEEFYMGEINPLMDDAGGSIPGFGRGGLAGEVQFWRDPILHSASGPVP